MAQVKLYVDTYAGKLVAGISNTSPASLPQFFQGDTISLQIYLLERTSTYPLSTPFTVVNIADLSLKVAIGPKTGTTGSTLYTQQFTWNKNLDSNYFYADLPLNTSGINTLLSGVESASAWFEIEYVQNAYPTTVYQTAITIQAEVIESGSVVTPAGQTALTVEVAEATFLKNRNTGFILYNPNTSAQVYVYLDDNGAFRADPIT